MRVVAVVPTYRNLQTLPAVSQGLSRAGFALIVVDDGSQDGTAEWAREWCGEGRERWFLSLAENRGKGAALESGFELARALGFDVAVSVDSDGQHLVEDAVRVRDSARMDAMVVGVRDDSVQGYPFRSRLGRRLWALGIRALSGHGFEDPICGLRAYPLDLLLRCRCLGGRFTWEEELLVRAAWHGAAFVEVPITTVYLPPGERVSHFSLWDWADSFAMFCRLAVGRLLLRGPRARSAGTPGRRDRSWRWIAGAACIAGGLFGALAPWWIAVPAIAWIGWRLHASLLLCVGAAVAASWSVESLAPLGPVVSIALVLACVVLLAAVTTRAARFLGSS